MNDIHAQIDSLLGVSPSPQRTARNQPHRIPLEAGRVHKRKPVRRVFHDASRTRAAIEALLGLPAAGETWHVIMAGAYDSFDLIPAMLELAAPATVESLHLATLGFNESNARRLIEMMGAGQIGIVEMIVSLWYEADQKEKEVCYRLATELPKRGGWYCAMRSHAKLTAARFSDGRCFVIESSANLRTCRNLEQFTITQDAELLEFHVAWMREARKEAVAAADRKD